jgi:arginase
MDLAIVTGGGPPELAGLAGEPPIVDPARVAVAGYRPEPAPGTVPTAGFTLERDLIDPAIGAIEAAEIDDPAGLGTRFERRLSAEAGRFWLHLDVDVIDPEVMPAVSYPEPGGLDLEATLELLRPLGRSGALIGVSVADLNSDLDPDDEYARTLSGLLAAALDQP